MKTAHKIISTLALLCASMASHAVTVDYSTSIQMYDDEAGRQTLIDTGSGQFSGSDANTDGLLTINELSAFTYTPGDPRYGWTASLNLASLNNFGTYNIAANNWSADSYVGGDWQTNVYLYGVSGGSPVVIAPHYGVTTSVVATAPVPEPETYAMMLAGLGALGWMGRRRQAKKA